MAKISREIESKAVNYLEDTISDTNNLSPEFERGDKKMSWDGFIIIHNDKNKNKDGVKRVPVQIKGITTIKEYKSVISYQINISDLKNYKNDGGVLFFVVVIIDKERKAYYKELLPIYIGHLLEKDNRKNITIELKELPSNKNDISAIVTNFYNASKFQNSTNIISFEDAIKEKIQIEQSIIVPLGHNPISYLLKNEPLTKAKIKVADKDIFLPIDTTGIEQFFEKKVNCSVKINDVKYYNEYRIIISKDSTLLKLSDCVWFECKDKSLVFHYQNLNILDNLYRDAPFIIAMIKNKKIFFGDSVVEIYSNISDFSTKMFSTIEQNYNIAVHIKELIKLFKAKEKSINFKDFTNTDYYVVEDLYDTLINNKYKHIDNLSSNLMLAKFGGYQFLLHLSEVKQKKYKVFDYMNCKLDFYCNIDSKNYSISKYCAVNSKTLFDCSNFSIENSIKDIKKYVKDEINIELAHQFALEMINYYDQTKQKEFLIESQKLLKWLYKNNNDCFDKTYEMINEYQIIKRLRQYTDLEKNTIKGLLKSTKDNSAKFGLYLLLDNEKEAIHFFKKLDEDAQSAYKEYPIYWFINKKDKD